MHITFLFIFTFFKFLLFVYSIAYTYVCPVGEGNGNPLQDSCLENPMDKGACGLQAMGSQESDTV